jgi:spermidine synthase
MQITSRLDKGWFREECSLWNGLSISIQVEKILFSENSRYQKIEVYQTKTQGRMLVLDGIIQLTEKDEFTYQEMMAHLPLMSHPDPKEVLVIGGGDGGVLREIARHETVRRIDYCEIDEMVIEVSKKFLPGLAQGFRDPRVKGYIEEGSQFLKKKSCEYDVIIVDSSDPVGPGETLFEKPFFQRARNALKPGGIVAAQGESYFLHPDYVKQLSGITRELFCEQAYPMVIVPTYLGGHINICMASLGPKLGVPAREVGDDLQAQLRYYSPEAHKAAFAMPYFASKLMET